MPGRSTVKLRKNKRSYRKYGGHNNSNKIGTPKSPENMMNNSNSKLLSMLIDIENERKVIKARKARIEKMKRGQGPVGTPGRHPVGTPGLHPVGSRV